MTGTSTLVMVRSVWIFCHELMSISMVILKVFLIKMQWVCTRGQKTISSFSINGRQIDGFRLSSGGDLDSQEFNVKWCPKFEPISGVGDESTQMTRVVFHLFNFVDLFGTRRSIEQNGTTEYGVQHVDLHLR